MFEWSLCWSCIERCIAIILSKNVHGYNECNRVGIPCGSPWGMLRVSLVSTIYHTPLLLENAVWMEWHCTKPYVGFPSRQSPVDIGNESTASAQCGQAGHNINMCVFVLETQIHIVISRHLLSIILPSGVHALPCGSMSVGLRKRKKGSVEARPPNEAEARAEEEEYDEAAPNTFSVQHGVGACHHAPCN